MNCSNNKKPLYRSKFVKSHLWVAMLVSLTTCEQIQQCIVNGNLRQCWNYVCTNGTPAEGVIDVKFTEKCASCNDGFALVNNRCEQGTVFVCPNGTPRDGTPSEGENVNQCTRCNPTYHLSANKTCDPNFYICTNGTAPSGRPTTNREQKCATCEPTYKMENEQCANRTKYTCSNGTPRDATNDNRPQGNSDAEECISCTPGYRKDNNLCVITQYTCSNGVAEEGNPPTGNENVEKCQSCSLGYILTNEICIIVDADGDGVSDVMDVDDDNDGLIEILNLTMLHNMRYNLAGTTYDDEAADTGTGDIGSESGAPNAANRANDYVCSSGSGLCGYELVQDLSFDRNGNSQTWSGSAGSYTLDSADSVAPYFITDNGGWIPIAGTFTAIFEGNGHTISYLAIQNNLEFIGMFAIIGGSAAIRNVGLVANLIDYSGHNGDSLTGIGGLVGEQRGGSITNSYTTGSADGSTGGADITGGLVGWQNGGSITNSYTTGSANSGPGGQDSTGGLVGQQSGGSITASYATGTTNGGTGGNDLIGGLVGHQNAGSITASYATGNINGGTTGGSKCGGLVGRQGNGAFITASYATGNVNGGAGGDGIGGLVGDQNSGSITASYATGNVNGEGGNDETGGLVGWQESASIIASYATGAVDGGMGTGDSVGMLIGRRTGSGSHGASYGLGTKSGGEVNGIDGTTLPAGVSSANDLTVSNAITAACVGIANSNAYITIDTCTATTKTACTWSYGTCSGNVTDINCKSFTSQTTCEATTKTIGTWSTNVQLWNIATYNTAGAWDFGTNSQAPTLKYADYDGSADITYNCNQFPSGVTCGTTLLPGQRD